MNSLNSDIIRVGQKLKINAGTFSILVDKSENTLVLKKDGEAVKTYTISTGKDNSTPVGVFRITDKVIGAPWTRPDGKVVLPGDPDYELGARWMAINEPGYGIHGTNDESTIGGQVTAGCVRMYNSDVIELYDIVTVGTEVRITD
ncbi:MAG: L,D-transpeptidase family protein [Candidatus Omnitrophica bacterium]|nr:L,D-transpeptidase family protein [Candidatus Omnitrophota bacterium]